MVLCVGAYKLIEGRRQAAAEAAGASYIAAIKQLGEGKVDDGTKALQGAAPVTPAVIPPATPAPPPAVPAKQPAAPGPAPQKK